MPSASIRRSLGSCLSVMFKAEQWFDLYFLDNDLHFLDNDLCELRPVRASVPYSKGNATRRYASLDVPHGTSSCGIFATLGEYFCSITFIGASRGIPSRPFSFVRDYLKPRHVRGFLSFHAHRRARTGGWARR